MVRLHHSEVTVRSQLGVGTTFAIHLPLGNEYLAAEEIADTASAPGSIKTFSPLTLEPGELLAPSMPIDEKLPTLLLIEDNAEMRAFITQMLTSYYRVTTARDGVEGVRLALENPPDLIISDLMMPEKDGYDVCRELKRDLGTSHVPIVLLTARASQDARLPGLEDLADDYLTKPFDARELLARAANLIRSRRLLRERFAASITVKPSELTVTSLDQDFLPRALEHVERHLDDPQLSVDHLANALNTSRTQLNLKLRALVNQSSNQFIKSVRLQRAAQLLRA